MSDGLPGLRGQDETGALGRAAASLVRSTSGTRRRAAYTLAVALLLAVVGVWYGAGVRIDTDLKGLLPKSAPSVIALDVLGERFGNVELLTIAVEEPDPAARQQLIDALAEEVRSWPETQRVSLGRDFTVLRDHALYFLEPEDLERLRDTLVKERRRAVSGVIRPGITDGGDPDPEMFVVEDDWDLVGSDEDTDDEGTDTGEEAPLPRADPGDDFDLRAWLEQQKAQLNELGTLSQREVDLIWPDENEDGELVWEDEIIDPFVSSDGTVQLLKAQLSTPPTDVVFAREMTLRVNDAVARLQAAGIAPEARAEVVAAYDMSREVNTILVDAKRATALSVVLVVLVLVAGFRRLRALALVVLPIGVATALTLAMARFMFAELNALTVFLFAVLFGMGVDFAVHLYAQRQSEGPETPWAWIVAHHIRPLASTMLTTAGSLFVLTAAEFKAFQEFGLISGIGVAICFACAVILVPAVDTLMGQDRRQPPTRTEAAQAQRLESAEPRSWRAARALALAGVAVFSFAGAPGLEFEKDITQLRVKRTGKKGISYGSASGRCSKSLVIMSETAEDLDTAVRRLEEERDAQRVLPDGFPGEGKEAAPWISGVYSVANAMPTDQAAKRAHNVEIAETANAFLAELPDRDEDARQYQTHLESLERLAKADVLTDRELPAWAIEPFTEKDGRFDRIAHVCLRINGSHLDELVAVSHRLGAMHADLQVRHADSRLVFADIITNIERDSQRLPWIAMLVIFVFIAADLRRPIATLACFGALALGLSLSIGVMGWWPIHINFFNLVVMPAVVGLGIDASIHLWHARTRATLDATAKASLLAGLTTVGGFAGLLVARHPGLHSIGVLGVVAVATCIGVAFLALYPLRRR